MNYTTTLVTSENNTFSTPKQNEKDARNYSSFDRTLDSVPHSTKNTKDGKQVRPPLSRARKSLFNVEKKSDDKDMHMSST